MNYMYYIIIAMALYAIVYLGVGLFNLDEFDEGTHIFIALCCIFWPFAIALALVVVIFVLLARGAFKIGERIRKLFIDDN